jgi:Zn-dependent M28 family amino/carboxypeptidase
MKSYKTLLFIIWMGIVSMACTLSSGGEEPPIIEPRTLDATNTPQPAITYATPLPGTPDSIISEAQQQQIEIEIYNLVNQVQSDRLMTHVTTLANFQTRHVNSPSNRMDYGVGAAASYIEDQFQRIQQQNSANFRYAVQEFPLTYNGITSTQRNIMGILQGTEPGAGVIVIGAHYDSRTWDQTDATGYAPGAADNGSGVAAIIEMARILSSEPRRATIVFVLFAAEEVGAKGSEYFIDRYLQQNNIGDVVMINVDTIGSWNDPQGNINDQDIRLFSSPPAISPGRQLARSLQFIAFNHELDLKVIMQDAIDREGRFGDHNSFDDEGYPAVRFIEALEDTPNREGNDTVDKVEAAYLLKSTRTILGVLVALADGPPPPKNVTLRDGGNGTATAVWEPSPDAVRYVVGLRAPGSLIYNPYFTVSDNRVDSWDGWGAYETFAIAAVDANGMIGRFSEEIVINQ